MTTFSIFEDMTLGGPNGIGLEELRDELQHGPRPASFRNDAKCSLLRT